MGIAKDGRTKTPTSTRRPASKSGNNAPKKSEKKSLLRVDFFNNSDTIISVMRDMQNINTETNKPISFDLLSICKNGRNAWAIGISGSEEEIKGEFYAWINHGATLAREMQMADSNFGWFWTTEEKMKKALWSREANRMHNSDDLIEYKGVKRGFWPTVEARVEAGWQILNTLVPTFTVKVHSKVSDVYDIACSHDVTACRPDDDADNLGLTSREKSGRYYKSHVESAMEDAIAKAESSTQREVGQ